jgi:hypothetical protein
VSAFGAALTRVAGIDDHDLSTGAFCLVEDHGDELAPPHVMDRTMTASNDVHLAASTITVSLLHCQLALRVSELGFGPRTEPFTYK